jgi:hypothetical protein
MNYPIEKIEKLTKLNNPNYKWAKWLGVWQIMNIADDEWVICVIEGRIYFRNEMDIYPTSEIHTDLDEALIVATSILNKHF